jgi:hypothetical protein
MTRLICFLLGHASRTASLWTVYPTSGATAFEIHTCRRCSLLYVENTDAPENPEWRPLMRKDVQPTCLRVTPPTTEGQTNG